MNRPPVIAILANHWESGTEEGWIARQVAGALAGVADVHVISPDGTRAGTGVDGVFTLHSLASPIDEAMELRRDLLVEGLSLTGEGANLALPTDVAALIDRDMVGPWRDAPDILAELRPAMALIVGHQNVGARAAVDRHDRDTPVTLLALATGPDSLTFPHFDQLFDRASSVLAVTETERSAVVAHHGRPEAVHRIGAPLAANSSALTEPNTWVGDTDYVLVLTNVDEDDDLEENELALLLRMRFPDHPVGIAHNDAFCAWRNGQVERGWPIERSSDLERLMAWARVTVDLHPGRLFARRCVTSLLYGTPIVVPHDSRAREHAERGKGGLWFATASELAFCVEAFLDPDIRHGLGAQGRSYAEQEYGSTDRFIERVVKNCGLSTPDFSIRVSA